MRKEPEPTELAERYADAHRTHYGEKNPRRAIELYTAIIAAHPESAEADYSRTQLQNIVHQVVPKEELFDAQVALAVACFDRRTSTDGVSAQGAA